MTGQDQGSDGQGVPVDVGYCGRVLRGCSVARNPMTDPAEIRAEGRRLLERYETSDPVTNRPTPKAVERWFWANADVLLADPAPVGLTEDEQKALADVRFRWPEPTTDGGTYRRRREQALEVRLAAIIDRLSAGPLDDEQVGWARPTVPPYENGRPRYEVAPLWAHTDESAAEGTPPWRPVYLSAAPVDDRERVPEGWRVEWRSCSPLVCDNPEHEPTPVLVPVSPSVDPEEG